MGSGKITKDNISVKDPFGHITKSAKEAEAEIKRLELTLTMLKEIAKGLKKDLPVVEPKDNKTIKDQNELFERANKLATAKLGVDKKLIKEKIRLQEATRVQNKVIRDEIKETNNLNNAYKTLTTRTNKAQAEFKRLAAQHGVNSKQADMARRRFVKLDSRLIKINKTARDGRRDVGRYGLAWGKLGGSIKSGLGFIGLTGLILGIGRALKNTFGRIREFDKEMQNLSGISGLTRKELSSTESKIKDVAGSSIKTSNEVAKLATTLFALGKSQSEVNKLLKPTNDLSIALGATSDEAGELLVSTLNAFQKGAESGQHFADVIAKMRTTTSLDFERIKDSLGFVSATASVLNLTIGETGALIGVLQDNGVKAARAGRLLNSSFIKLAKEGKTLKGSLDRINKAKAEGKKGSDLLRIAEKDFGTQSASLGVILASNTDKIAELSNEFDNLSEGSLKELTDTQLESLDAKLKILDSTWESLILSIESGDGAFSRVFKNATIGITNFLNKVRQLNQSFGQNLTENLSETNKDFIEKLEGQIKDNISLKQKELEDEFKILESRKNRGILSEKELINEKKKLTDGFDSFSEDARNEELRKQKKFLEDTIAQQTKGTKITVDNAEELLETLSKIAETPINVVNAGKVEEQRAKLKIAREKRGLVNSVIINKDRIRLIQLLLDEQDKVVESEEEQENIIAKKKKSIRELIGLIEKQAKVVSDLRIEIQRATSEDDIFDLANKVDIAKKELDRLKRIVSSSREEFDKRSISLIEDDIDRTIAAEKAKSEAILKLIRSNATTTITEKQTLIAKETKRLDTFTRNQEIKRGKARIKLEADLAKAEFEQTRKGFKTQEAFDKEKEAQFLAIKRNALEDELKLLEEFGSEKTKVREEQIKAELENLGDAQVESIEIDRDAIEKGLELTENLLTEHYDRRLSLIEREKEAHEKNFQAFEQAARDGSILAKESLAEEQRLANEAQVEEERIEREKQQVLMVAALLKAFNSELAAGKTTGEALSSAIVNTTLLQQFAKALPAFIEGTEHVGSSLGVPQLSGQDGYIIRVDGNERIVDPANNVKIGNYSNDEVANIMEQHRLNKAVGETPVFVTNNNSVDGINELRHEMKLVKDAIIDKPVSNIELGKISQMHYEIKETTIKGNRSTVNRFIIKR